MFTTQESVPPSSPVNSGWGNDRVMPKHMHKNRRGFSQFIS
jgi:hypothetical protein